MAKLAYMLALVQASLISGRPGAYEQKRHAKFHDKRMIELSSSLEITTSYSSAIVSSLQSATITVSPSITATFLTGLPSGGFTRDPMPTISISDVGSLAPIHSTLAPGTNMPKGTAAENVFVPMATDAPPKQITSRDDHAVKKLNIIDQDVPIETNKFYANFFLGNQTNTVWTLPYALSWARGYGNTYGMAVTHTERSQLAWGEGDVPRYFIGPIGLQHIVFSAEELGDETALSTEKLTAFSAYANLSPKLGAEPIMSFPCVQGMGFVTALYNTAKPVLTSGTFFRTLKYVEQLNGITYKYQIELEDNSHWLLYATPVASLGAPPFELKDSATIIGPEGFVGMIQVAKNPSNTTGEASYDSTAGAYAVNATISGSVDGSSGSYTLSWAKDGVQNQTLLMFALPHHVEAFDEATTAALTDIELVTTVKGYAKAVIADSITMVEAELPDTMGFAPWVPTTNGGGGGSSNEVLSAEALAAVNSAGALELAQDFDQQTRLDSMYYSGKGLAKFAGVIYTIQTMAKNTELAAAGLVKLKDAFNVFVNNTQPLPLVYDSVWKGVVSSGTYESGDTGVDFGNTLYNDHHFHYGYFVYTAAIIGHLDPTWLEAGDNKAWVNMLVRDFANPSIADPFFPFQRSFDWYNGHSWAKGLFDSGDGKDQESSSEDTFSTYGLKMWGEVSGDANMQARGNLQLAVTARSVRSYFLLESTNKVQPERFLPNKVTGILFENKVDHTTYFGANPEYIQGIHMIPLAPNSAYVRTKTFVQEEWDVYFSNGRAENVTGGWKSILFANLALIDPVSSYNYFADPNFDPTTLDGGASRTWYLAYSAAMGGVVGSQSEAEAGTPTTTTEAVVQVGTPAAVLDDTTPEEVAVAGDQAEEADDSDTDGVKSDVEGRSSDEESGWDYSEGEDDWDSSDLEGRSSDAETKSDWESVE